ncbi:MAG: SpoIIE family protein phosphatase, partial [Flavobacteriales bacterium]|nr:SpoIIE family protein phosphatase [Flavobacteriales bacterium]
KYNNRFGLNGTVENILRYNDTLYAATQSGLYYFNEETNRFVDTKTTHLECWGMDIVKIDGQNKLLVAANDGIYELKNRKLEKIWVAYPWHSVQNPSNEKEILLGLDGGLGVLNYSDTGWRVIDTNTIIQGDVFNLNVYQSKIWLGTKQNGVYVLDPNEPFAQPEHISSKNGLPDFATVIALYNNQVYLGTKHGLFILDGDSVIRSTLLEDLHFENDTSTLIHRMSTDSKGRLWMVTYNDRKKTFDLGYISSEDSTLQWNNSDFSVASEEIIHSIFHDKNDVTWLGGTQGAFKYQPYQGNQTNLSYPVYITSLRHKEDKDSAIISLDINIYAPNIYSYEDHNLWIEFAAPSYFGDPRNNKSRNEYSYYLEGVDLTWPDWKKKTDAVYQNLDEGDYIFHLKAKDFYGNISEELTYRFTILPPWYRTIWAYVLYFIAFMVVLFIAIRLSIRRVKKQNEKLEEIIKERTAKVVAQKEEIEIQKDLVDEKNRDIMDSIKYAERIQTAILPPFKLVRDTFKDSFILFKPKDIVSGDFYWLEVVNDIIYFAAVDCTGHGVPGAMVSVLGHNGLNRCVKEFGLTEPAKILDKLTQLVEETFEKSEDQVRDGMDISLCKVDLKTRAIEYAGANNPMWIISKKLELKVGENIIEPIVNSDDQNLFEIKADKYPIGKYEHRKPYKNHVLKLNENDRIYLFTDGYADQFGGAKGKKFKYKPFKKLLLDTVNASMKQQHLKIDKVFEEWKGELEQIDDVCLFGVQL